MVSKQKLREIIKREGKKAGNRTLEKIDLLLYEEAKKIVARAKINADFDGRITIKEEDVSVSKE